MRRKDAEMIIANSGWLAAVPGDFRDQVISRCALKSVQPGTVVFRRGDAPGGIYGLVLGNVTLNTAPPHRRPRLIQTGLIGSWMGADSFLTQQPRRGELQVRTPSVLMHLPLQDMEQMATEDPKCLRYFAQILLFIADALIRTVNDLQINDSRYRVAAILDRINNAGEHQTMIPLTQAEIGEMAGATRRQVNAAMKDFSSRGWIQTHYRMIEVLDPAAIRAFYETVD